MKKQKFVTSLRSDAPPVRCAHRMMARAGELKPHPRNPNKHAASQIRLLCKIIAAQGWRHPIVVSKRSGYVVAGHGRLLAAQEMGLEWVPVDYQDFESEEQEWAHLIADNRIAELAEMDRSMLRELAEQMDSGSFDMELTGFDRAALEELMTAAPPGAEVDAEPKFDEAKKLRAKFGIKRGQIWKLGAHRIVCGDCTDVADTGLLGDQGGLMVTDPPYGVDYDPEWRARVGVNRNRKKMGKVSNDEISDWSKAWGLFTGGVAYVFHAGVHAATVQRSLESAGFGIRSQIIWAKDRMALSRGDYHWQHEPCWYAVRSGQNGRRTNDRSQTTLWTIPTREDSGHGHSTQKPTECMARAIRNHTFRTCYDPFVGSGTTIIACEQLKRQCRAMDIDPEYVAVAIQRWMDATGKEAKLVK